MKYTEFFLITHDIRNYVIDLEDDYVDVDGDVYLSNTNLSYIPVKFRKVKGDFSISYNNLKTLENCPIWVYGNFNCMYNRLVTLNYGPKHVKGIYNCANNKIISLDHVPMDIDPDKLWYSHNRISQKEADRYWIERLDKDPFIIFKIRDKISDELKEKYAHLLAADDMGLL